jgi:tetratricopeptide (TPR) repeat protein
VTRKPPSKTRTRAATGAALLVLVGAGLVLAFYFQRVRPGKQAPAPPVAATGPAVVEPPAFDTTGVDPAVASAVLEARSAVLQSPGSDAAWGRLGMLLAAHDFAESASECFRQAERLNPRDVRWAYYQGTPLCTIDPAVSIDKLSRAAELLGDDPASTPIRLRLGETLLSEGRLDDARGQFEHALRLEPQSAPAHLNLARVARQKGDLETALSHLGRCAADPRTRKACHLLTAEVRRRLNDAPGAEAARAAAERMPDDARSPDPWVEQVERLRTGKKVELAAALRLIQRGRFAEAVALLEPTTRESPDADAAWLLLGRAYFKLRDFTRAEPALRRAAQLNPDAPQPHFFLGTMLLYQGKNPAAEAELRHAVRLKPDYADAHQNLGHCLLTQNKLGDAADAFRTAVACDPNFVEAHVSLADVLARRGDTAQALVHLRRATSLDPKHERANELLGRIGK